MCLNNFKVDNNNFDDFIGSNNYVMFHKAFVDYYFDIIDFESKPYETSRPPYDDKNMFNLISYAYSQNITSSIMIEEFARFHMIYIYVSDGIKPSQVTIHKFIREKLKNSLVLLKNS